MIRLRPDDMLRWNGVPRGMIRQPWELRSQKMKTIVRFFGLAAMVSVLLLLEGCAGLYGGGQRKTNADVTLISYGSVNGELAPCG